MQVVLNYVDRTNLAFAAIQLNEDLGFSAEVGKFVKTCWAMLSTLGEGHDARVCQALTIF